MRENWVNPTTTLLFNNFVDIQSSTWRLFRHSVGDHAFEETGDNGSDVVPIFTTLFVAAFTIVGTLMMTNLLIAMVRRAPAPRPPCFFPHGKGRRAATDALALY